MADDWRQISTTPLLSVVIPTFNESRNVRLHFAALQKTLGLVPWEAIYVDDDSPDGTNKVLREMAQEFPNLRLIHRIGRRGLSSAVIEGILSTSSPYIAVMDCDLQHDETILPTMLKTLQSEKLDIVIGSRFVSGGSTGDWDNKRLAMSKFAARVSRLIVKQDLSDPMSGFFMVTREAFENTVKGLSGHGFKILLDLFASSPTPLRFKEVPFTFGLRQHGESKVDSTVLLEYAFMLIDKYFGGFVPPRLVFFSLVGALGTLVHFAVLSITLFVTRQSFEYAQSLATLAAMTSNFFMNNEITFRDKRLRRGKLVWGLVTFYLVCFVGLLGNVGISSYLFYNSYTWWLSAIAGIAIGTIWNYAVSESITWKRK
jgi:dolichol-phosphate mannosyltransferase